jgi:Acyl-protein synthetase, LuxE
MSSAAQAGIVAGIPSADDIFNLSPAGFAELEERVLRHQGQFSPVYARYAQVTKYLPIEAFKFGPVCDHDPEDSEGIFLSSGTSGTRRARHYVRRLGLYNRSIEAGFERVFGPGPFRVLACLPSYAPESSLVYMANRLMETYGAEGSGYFLESSGVLRAAVCTPGAPILILGAAFGLLDLLETGSVPLPDDTIVIETGGMKTHRRSIARTELHARIGDGFALRETQIWSEYGMCELLSQCYSRAGELFRTPPWMRVSVRDPHDPTRDLPDGSPGALAVVDLANVHSASAILTQDRGVTRPGGFEVLGRLSGAELRGCNNLLERA